MQNVNRTARVLSCAVTALIMSACASSRYVTDYCAVAVPIYASEDDTEATIEQIVEHNAVLFELCPEHRPKDKS